jgi:high-affinity iron transporter
MESAPIQALGRRPHLPTLSFRSLRAILIAVAVVLVSGVLVWQAVTAKGAPDPTDANLSPLAAVVDTGILVFREGLEAILVLAAIAASLVRRRRGYGQPIAVGAALATLATLATWFVVVAIISAINLPELDVQAGTGLLAIVVLLIIMNWFFHKIYWTGWIAHHNRRGRHLVESPETEPSSAYAGLILLGFTAIYREGFEIVLFLQNLRLKAGSIAILEGAAIGLGLTAVVAVLTFIAHHHLPYKKMLVFTGVMLGGVLIVMVGESVQELQLARWIGTTPVNLDLPAWLGVWFAVFPTVESLAAQVCAAFVVIGSYVAAEYVNGRRSPRIASTGT